MYVISIKSRYLENIKKEVKISTVYWTEKIIMSLSDASFEELAREFPGMSKNFRDQIEITDFFEVSILSKEGKILSSSSPAQINHSIDSIVMSELKGKDNETQIIKNNNVYEVISPVLYKNAIEGYILVRYPTNIINEIINQEIVKSILITVALLVILVSVLVIFIKLFLTNQINEILQTLQQIKHTGDLSLRIENNSGDEIGQLAEMFNKMMNVIQKATKQLEQTLREQQKNPLIIPVALEEVLTPRELEAYQHHCRKSETGNTVKKIAEKMGITEQAVRNYIYTAKTKLKEKASEQNLALLDKTTE